MDTGSPSSMQVEHGSPRTSQDEESLRRPNTSSFYDEHMSSRAVDQESHGTKFICQTATNNTACDQTNNPKGTESKKEKASGKREKEKTSKDK